MKLFIGIDISKNTMDIYCNNKDIKVPNNQKGLAKLYSVLKQEIKDSNEIALVVCEATGGYEQKLVKFLLEKNIPVHIAHPNKVRHHIQSKGIRTKTDKLDARLLADYGETMKVKPYIQLRTVDEEALAGLLKRREQLKQDKAKEVMRLDKDLNKGAEKSVKSHIKWLEKEMIIIEELIKKLQKDHEDINTKIELLKSVPSVGDITASILVAFLPELGSTKDAKKITALVGLVPFTKESGKYKGERFIQGGRTIVRQVLYMAALSAIRYYKEMREFYLRLKNKGKKSKVALIAVERKLLTVLNSVMYRKTVWQNECPL